MNYIFKFIYNSHPLSFIVFSVVEVVIIFIALSGILAPAQDFFKFNTLLYAGWATFQI